MSHQRKGSADPKAIIQMIRGMVKKYGPCQCFDIARALMGAVAEEEAKRPMPKDVKILVPGCPSNWERELLEEAALIR